MSNFLNLSVLVLSTMVLMLAGMVGYLYWQQNKLLRTMSSLSTYVSQMVVQEDVRVSVEEETPESKVSEVPVHETNVHEESEQVIESITHEEPDVDDLQTKTAAELRELLNKKGIPFGKRDSKTVLLELLKAAS